MRQDVLVFLDRDGVINRPIIKNKKPYAPQTLKDFYIYKYCYPSLIKLRNLGVKLVVITNQPDVGNGYMNKDILEEMHVLMLKTLPVDIVKSCIHSQKDGCLCRKPGVALMSEAFESFKIKPRLTFMVGDRKSDMEAGKRFGCKTIFIDRHYAENVEVCADYQVKNLLEASSILEKCLKL